MNLIGISLTSAALKPLEPSMGCEAPGSERASSSCLELPLMNVTSSGSCFLGDSFRRENWQSLHPHWMLKQHSFGKLSNLWPIHFSQDGKRWVFESDKTKHLPPVCASLMCADSSNTDGHSFAHYVELFTCERSSPLRVRFIYICSRSWLEWSCCCSLCTAEINVMTSVSDSLPILIKAFYFAVDFVSAVCH